MPPSPNHGPGCFDGLRECVQGLPWRRPTMGLSISHPITPIHQIRSKASTKLDRDDSVAWLVRRGILGGERDYLLTTLRPWRDMPPPRKTQD